MKVVEGDLKSVTDQKRINFFKQIMLLIAFKKIFKNDMFKITACDELLGGILV